MTLLKVKNVFKQYGAHLVLEAADLEINEGEIVGFSRSKWLWQDDLDEVDLRIGFTD